jgi:hypothetical protein
MSSTLFKPTIPASKGPQTHATDHIATGLLPYALFTLNKSSFSERQIYSNPKCSLEHFTFYHLSAICHINVQQYTAFETLSHAILLSQKNENQK